MEDIKPGDYVSIVGQDTVAEVLLVKGNELEIGVGAMKMKVKKNKVKLAEKPFEAENTLFSNPGPAIDTKERLLHFQFKLDVRGKAKEEVMTELSSWADDAILLGVEEAKIVHGRGTGILKDTVRAVLRKYKEIQSLSDGTHQNGGDHVTIVRFKV